MGGFCHPCFLIDMKDFILCILALIVIVSCQNSKEEKKADIHKTGLELALESWNNTASKEQIIEFVKSVSDSQSEGVVPIKDRIAVFDNDGTLWCEQPMYTQLFFAIDQIKSMASDHPEWNEEMPFKAILENDQEAISKFNTHDILSLVMASHSGTTDKEFESSVLRWMKNARHPRFDKRFDYLTYQPMVELLAYLREHGFKTYIVSGGGIEFMRPMTYDAYGIPKEQVIGFSIKTEFSMENGEPVICRLPELNFIDDKEGKPVAINHHIGKKPILAVGNSDGDLQMLQYATIGKQPSMGIIIHHTDSIREYAYDRTSHIGKLDKVLDEAKEHNWLIVNMEKDWKLIFKN